MSIYKKYSSKKLKYKNSIEASESIVSLPSSVNLSNNEINYISDTIKEFFKH